MEFKEQIKQLGDRVAKLRDQVKTEEATKSAFIMPFIQALGYDLFNPLEVVPEFVTDFGAKNAEKVDFVIMKDSQPIMIIECKNHPENLDKHYTQVHKYFHLTKARFAVLTNGVLYNFYTDLDNANKMDEKPFLSFDITNIREQQIKELVKFHKNGFDVGTILNTASELKYSNAIKTVLTEELSNPTPEFVKYFIAKVYSGRTTEKVLNQFSEIVKKTIDQTFNDIVSDRLMNAINQTKTVVEIKPPTPEPVESEESKIVTTSDEMESYFIIKSILRATMPINRIFFRDAQTYFSILIDDKNTKLVCRLYLNSETNRMIVFLDENKKEIKYKLKTLDDIYAHTELLIKAAEKFK